MSGVPYHAWTHLPKEMGGTDPIFIPPAGSAAAYCFASKSAFTQVGTGPLGWVDVDTSDTSIFSVSTSTVTNDTIDIAEPGLLLVFCYAVINTPANDWGIGTAMAQSNPGTAGGAGFGASTGSYNGLALGAKGFEFRMAQITTTSDVVVTITRAGSAGYAGAWMHLAHWPIGNTTWTDIL